jgi:hypothetical protein
VWENVRRAGLFGLIRHFAQPSRFLYINLFGCVIVRQFGCASAAAPFRRYSSAFLSMLVSE